MPEGDTIFKLARTLGSAWEGHRVEALWIRGRGRVTGLEGGRVREVAPLGKHLLVAFDPVAERGARRRGREWVAHLHLGMNGRFRRHPGGRPAGGADFAVRVAPDVASSEPESASRHPASTVWQLTGAATAELLPRDALRDHPALRRLGPDLLALSGPVLRAEIRRRIAARVARGPGRCVADLLLDQCIACGIGNVYKCEVLFLAGLHPAARSDQFALEVLVSLYESAAQLLRRNAGSGRRTTRDGGLHSERFWVYRRAGRPCLRCRAPIAFLPVGEGTRVTYWCPRCQSEPRTARAAVIAKGVHS